MLYKLDSNGNVLEWICYRIGDVVFIVHGRRGGKKQVKSYKAEPTNVGKMNERDSYEQAEFEVRALTKKQFKNKGYTDTLTAALRKDDFIYVKGGVLPMLAFDINKTKETPEMGDFVQPKLDGHRCIALRAHGKWSLWSRTRKMITSMPHIEEELAKHFPGDAPLILDGELYNHALKHDFEKLTSAIRKQEPTEESRLVQYHVYDIVNTTMNQADRLFELTSICTCLPTDSCIVWVPTHSLGRGGTFASIQEHYLNDGYEGVMIRKSNGMYEQKRSRNLLKVKKFDDSEFKVVGYHMTSVDTLEGPLTSLVLDCVTEDGKLFGATVSGKKENHQNILEGCVGKMATVKFFGLTAAGVPRFPVFKAFREEPV